MLGRRASRFDRARRRARDDDHFRFRRPADNGCRCCWRLSGCGHVAGAGPCHARRAPIDTAPDRVCPPTPAAGDGAAIGKRVAMDCSGPQPCLGDVVLGPSRALTGSTPSTKLIHQARASCPASSWSPRRAKKGRISRINQPAAAGQLLWPSPEALMRGPQHGGGGARSWPQGPEAKRGAGTGRPRQSGCFRAIAPSTTLIYRKADALVAGPDHRGSYEQAGCSWRAGDPCPQQASTMGGGAGQGAGEIAGAG